MKRRKRNRRAVKKLKIKNFVAQKWTKCSSIMSFYPVPSLFHLRFLKLFVCLFLSVQFQSCLLSLSVSVLFFLRQLLFISHRNVAILVYIFIELSLHFILCRLWLSKFPFAVSFFLYFNAASPRCVWSLLLNLFLRVATWHSSFALYFYCFSHRVSCNICLLHWIHFFLLVSLLFIRCAVNKISANERKERTRKRKRHPSKLRVAKLTVVKDENRRNENRTKWNQYKNSSCKVITFDGNA